MVWRFEIRGVAGSINPFSVREGRRHTIVRNLVNGAESQVPRHREIKTATAKAICKDLDVEPPSEA